MKKRIQKKSNLKPILKENSLSEFSSSKRTRSRQALVPVPITNFYSDNQLGGKPVNKTIDIENSDNLLKNKYKHIINYFQKTMPNAPFELNYNNGYELIVSLVLSARQTDKGVNELTPTLFKKYPSFEELSKAKTKDVYKIIEPINFSTNKTKYLIDLSKKIINIFDGQIPNNVKDLVSLPGVGQKTANMIMSLLYDVPAMSVDTHVLRVSQRTGLSKKKSREAVEDDLTKNIPEEYLNNINKCLILHGRYVCTFSDPKCKECKISKWCDYFQDKKKEK